MALVHDMAEAIVGDITPDDDICEQEKRELELEAMQTFCLSHFLGEQSHAAKEFLELWQEYEEDSTVEARLVKQVDKLEMALQAYVYERDQSANLDDFFASAKSKLHNEIFKDWLARVLKLREEVTRKGEKSNLE
ncbi:5'-deoxynucleotidase HDDC2-like [Schistocerca gregaria]|uniref:5'-deoxynucleotidase HDDC2-like n=1 Tax=Schistocerca gregaria TaxID=7010 RepID=UPI00211E846D|nr:5'-deoxynucleotidase HDDC2-like [Schistocerca gregaria]